MIELPNAISTLQDGPPPGQPRYSVIRLTKRRIFARWGVMCGTSTWPAFRAWRYYTALRVRALLEGAYLDGHFVGNRELPELERLRQEIERYDSAIAGRDLEIERLRPALEVAQQAILEFYYAQLAGPQWYTHGKDGMYRQVRMWLQRGMEAVAAALEPPCTCAPDRPLTAGHADNCQRHLRSDNTRSYSKAFVLELLGYLTGAIPELHAFESGRMIRLFEEFERKHGKRPL